MMCPHCQIAFNSHTASTGSTYIGSDADGDWFLNWTLCPTCNRLKITLQLGHKVDFGGEALITRVKSTQIVRPSAGSSRPPCPSEVPDALRSDYAEACAIVGPSPKASAALSRRCLQSLIHDTLNIKRRDLNAEIQSVLDSNTLPSHLAESIDAVRTIGNFGAHPIKSTNTGEILDVEPGEAEWNLDTLEQLFDFYFVAPARTAAKRAAHNAKLEEAGKPELK